MALRSQNNQINSSYLTRTIKVVDDYFDAWQSYDNSILCRIFDKKAKYIIRPRNRKLIGIKEICRYWGKNESRQRNLILNWSIAQVKPLQISCDFTAKFFDVEENQNQEIIGKINYRLCKNLKILSLSETYKKNIKG